MTARLAPLTPDRLSAEQRAVYEAIAGGRRAEGVQAFPLTDTDGALVGPFNAFLLHPRLGLALQEVGARLRFEGSLTDRCREIAILVVAAHHDSGFERYAHEAVGRQVGLGEAELAAVAGGRHTDLTDPTERLVADTTAQLTTDGDLDDAAYAAAVDALGEPGVLELSTLVGYYATLALQLRVFRVTEPTFPPR